MVDSVSARSSGPIRRPGDLDKAAPQARVGISGMAQTTGASAESVSLGAMAQTMPGELRSGPPIDTAAVGRIKQAISNGKYPVNYEALTESLFQNYRELQN